MKMEMEVSDKVAEQKPKTHIKKGFYHARLTEVKPKKAEGKHGKKVVLVFELLDEKLKVEGQYLKLATEMYSEYRQEDGSYRTAVTPNSRLTKTFKNLGWEFNTVGLSTDKFVGAEAEVLVDEYEYSYIDQATNTTSLLKASTIKEVNKWEDEVKVGEEVV